MPEGDTIVHLAARLGPALAARTLVRSDFRVPALATLDLSGRDVEAVVPRGKHLLIRVAGGTTVHSHLQMDGDWAVVPAGRGWAMRGPWSTWAQGRGTTSRRTAR